MSTHVDRITRTVIAGVGLCAATLALSPHAAAVPFKTGGAHCNVQDTAGTVPAGAGAAGPAGAGGAVPCCGAAGGGAAGPAGSGGPGGGGAAAAATPCNAVDAVALSGIPVGVPVLPGPVPAAVPQCLWWCRLFRPVCRRYRRLCRRWVRRRYRLSYRRWALRRCRRLCRRWVRRLSRFRWERAPLRPPHRWQCRLWTRPRSRMQMVWCRAGWVSGPSPAGVGPSGGVPTQPGPQSRSMAH